MNTDSMYPKVREIIADVLAIEESEIERDGSLIDDYGAESIDFLDLVYRLEREFKVKIPRGQIEEDVRAAMGDADFERDGRVTEEGLVQLRQYLSEVPEERIEPNMPVNLIPTLFTAETFCKVVLRALERSEQSAAS
jgi:acyl carrier protein